MDNTECSFEHSWNPNLFQSQYKTLTEVCLTKSVVIPARTGTILERKIVKSTSADIDTVKANYARAYEPGSVICGGRAESCSVRVVKI